MGRAKDGDNADVRLLPARVVGMTDDERAAAVEAMAALLAHARPRPVLEGGRGGDVCLTAAPTPTTEEPPA